MGLIDRIAGPEDLKALPGPRLPELAEEIRAFLVENVSKTGGHLGPNLGVVELTIALHRVFDSPSDAILFDTGHQSYVHKILTGRHDFSALRREGGLSGYPSRAESAHDVVENIDRHTDDPVPDTATKAQRQRAVSTRAYADNGWNGLIRTTRYWLTLTNTGGAWRVSAVRSTID